MILRKLVASTAGVLLLAALAGVDTAGTAEAASKPIENTGENVPAQPYLNNPDSLDWLGSYTVGGKQSWCINFALAAPLPDEQFITSTTTLNTKWGTPVDATTASEISYLLLRNGNTTSPDTAAALAFLLHSWTSAPQNPGQLAPSNTFQTITFDAPTHLTELTNMFPAAATAVATMKADATANHGPWTTSMTAPSPLVIGTATNWTIMVLNTNGKGVANVPVTITATGATLPNGTATQVISTPGDGSPLAVAVTPTGPSPTLTATLSSPAPTPVVMLPIDPKTGQVDPNTQKVVTTGGTKQLMSTATGTAQTPPGNLTITKTDANTNQPLTGASLEVTGADKKTAALKQDGTPLVGTDGKPIVLVTAANGTAMVTGLKTPQTVCVIETTPPPGFDQAFNANSPPTVCGTVNPGAMLQLALTNVPNKIPVAIPAGGAPPTVTAMAVVVTRPLPAALIGFGGLLVVGAAMASTVFARRRRR